MKKIVVGIFFTIFLFSCSEMRELPIIPYKHDVFSSKIRKLVEKLDNNLKSLNFRTKRLRVGDFKGDKNTVFENILKEKVKNELFLRGYILTDKNGEMELKGKYFVLKDSVEIFIEIEDTDMVISFASEKIPLSKDIKQIISPDLQDFVSLER